MPFPYIAIDAPSRPPFRFPVLIYFIIILLWYGAQASSGNQVTNIGAIVDVDTRTGKEEKIAMEIAARSFNGNSRIRKVSLSFLSSSVDPSKVAADAEELIKEKKVNVIIGMHSWQEAALVADVGDRARVPVLSFAAPAITSPFFQLRWPFLIRMANNGSAQVQCIADIVRECSWRKVVVIYEEDADGGGSGMSLLLAKALQKFDTEIDHQLALPPFSSISDPKGLLHNELVKLEKTTRCRVFVVLQSSLPMATNLLGEAKTVGLVGGESAWIIPESITNQLHSVENSVISSMQGTIGIKTSYSDDSNSHKKFSVQFQRKFRSKYPEEDYSKPGIYALRAYDSIRVVTQAIKSMARDGNTLLEDMLSRNFSGLSGHIRFQGREPSQTPMFKVMYVDGKGCRESGSWPPTSKAWLHLDRIPKGWATPTPENPLKIVVPGDSMFKEFVRVVPGRHPDETTYDGFSIQVFNEVCKNLDNRPPYKLETVNCSYDDLVELVANKTYDAAVGDITILAYRSKKVEFTQPYAESRLLVLVPMKPEDSAWMFLKPFTWKMWLVTLCILIYTMFIVWFLEHPSNPEFTGGWKSQIGTSLWFTFSSIFFAHRERINSSLTRVVVAMWMFVVFVLTSSYTANLSSMLTIQRQGSGVTIEGLITNNYKVGYERGTFVGKYLEKVGFDPENVIEVKKEESYLSNFERNDMSAALLELPYVKVFQHKHRNGYSSVPASPRFGGLGFAFQKGSPIVKDFSEAILKISESGRLGSLEDQFLTSSNECPTNATSSETKGLSLRSFWVLYVIYFSTSTICFLLALFNLIRKYQHTREANQSNVTPNDVSFWNKAARLATCFYRKEIELRRVGPVQSSNNA